MKNDAISDLAALRDELDRWRAARSRRQRIPDEFWDKAVALLEHHSPTAICRELRLNSKNRRVTSSDGLCSATISLPDQM